MTDDREVASDQIIAEPSPSPSPSSSPVREIVDTDELSQGRLVFGARTSIGLGDPAFAALAVFNHLVGSDSHSRLHRTLREEAGLCYYVGSFLEPLCQLMFVEAGIDTGDYVEARSSIEQEFQAIAEDGPGDEEVARAKTQLTQRLSSLPDDRDALMRFYLARRIGVAAIARTTLAGQIQSVTAKDVREVARRVQVDTVYFLAGNGVGAEGA